MRQRSDKLKVPDAQSMWTSELLAALNASPIGTFIVQERQFKFTSKQFQRYLGYSEEEMLGADSMSFVLPEDRDRVRENAVQMLKGLRSDPYEYRSVTKNGELRWIIGTVAPIQYHGQRAALGYYMDITERRKIQEQLIAQDRLASIGELTAGIAHEISNPLATVIGYADWLLKRDIPDEIKKDLEAIHRGAKRACNILERLLTFAGQRGTERDYVNINHVLEIAIELRRHSLLSSNIEVIRQFDDELPIIMADGGQLQDVFLNVIMNAEYSMREAHGRGKLTVTTGKTDGNIRISLKDDGAGISKENISKVFEPFFTTKPVGIGTGLGLSICHRIITAHGGRIYAESEFGRGATVIIELPTIVANEKSKSEN